MKHSVHHGLELQLARRVIRHALGSYVERFAEYNPRLSWNGDDRAEIAFSALGSTVRGGFKLTPRSVEIDMDVPLLLRPFRSRALNVVEREIREWIARAQRGELGDVES
ncbi:MAG: polyhydroxyalkanoic acid system family protein [Pseudomonadota bacterium]